MKITIFAVGRLKDRYLQEGLDEYLDRLKHYSPVELVRLREESKTDRAGEAEAIAREGTALLERITPQDRLVALSEEGTLLTSRQWAEQLNRFVQSGCSRLVLVVGSGPGLALAVKERADLLLSLSRLTFPHQLALLLLLEQLYRGWTILRGEPYHR